MEFATIAANRINVLHVGWIIDERSEKDLMLRGEVLQQMVRTHLVAFVGRVGQAMDEVQNVRHRYPKLRTICGPSQLARPMGMRFHASMNNLYLALFGLF